MSSSAAQHLLIDGDDTLWENNVYFEESVEAFIDLLDHSSLSREQVRAVVDEVESLNIANHGYGSAAFGRNLQEAYRRLAERAIRPEDLDRILELGRRVVSQPMQLIAGVEPTLEHLAGLHDLTLFTKGEQEEQRMKVERSGLDRFFDRVVVTPEKDVAAYRKLVEDHDLDPGRAWMIGNSPRSDVNPPLEAGLRAVFIPHPRTWSLEVVEVAESDRPLILERFEQLAEHF